MNTDEQNSSTKKENEILVRKYKEIDPVLPAGINDGVNFFAMFFVNDSTLRCI